jgi:hypothetical protein
MADHETALQSLGSTLRYEKDYLQTNRGRLASAKQELAIQTKRVAEANNDVARNEQKIKDLLAAIAILEGTNS